MQHINKNSSNGFATLVGMLFFSAILTIVLFIHVERLAALEDELSGAVKGVYSEVALFSCGDIDQLIQTTRQLYMSQQKFSIDFSLFGSFRNKAIIINATSCPPL